jgi:hypothetical protein
MKEMQYQYPKLGHQGVRLKEKQQKIYYIQMRSEI